MQTGKSMNAAPTPCRCGVRRRLPVCVTAASALGLPLGFFLKLPLVRGLALMRLAVTGRGHYTAASGRGIAICEASRRKVK
jgi:hypothetical protein